MNLNSQSPIIQFAKYAIVGVMNTLLTLIVIFLCKSVFGINAYVSNAIGYIVGVINSFIWNRQWVFRSNGALSRQAVHFIIGFLVCYAVQFLVVWTLNQFVLKDVELHIVVMTLSGYGIATLIGNVCYTLCNFVSNRLITFKK
jgi:putative flippase GtrA